MDISIFAVTGPIMVGPSSSHTAGAARLARIARAIAAEPFRHASFGLHGSFAKTYKGHGTDRALVAGVLGLREDDEQLGNAFALAAQRGITFDFQEIELENVHENTVQITFLLENGKKSVITGSSTGGGRIVICDINGFATDFTAESATLIIRQQDTKGVISDVTTILAESDINIGIMRLSRHTRGDTACCTIETDNAIGEAVVARICALDTVLSAQAINLEVE